jgi:Vacuolar protein sorting-associated protein 35
MVDIEDPIPNGGEGTYTTTVTTLPNVEESTIAEPIEVPVQVEHPTSTTVLVPQVPSSSDVIVMESSEGSHSNMMEQWGDMGGGIGEDNAFLVQAPTPVHVHVPSTVSNPVVSNMAPYSHYSHQLPSQPEYASTASVFMTEQQQQQQPLHQGGGSITRFAMDAAVGMGVGVGVDIDIDATVTTTSSGTPTNTGSTTTTSSTGTATYISPFAKPAPAPPMTFAERSQQAYIISGSRLPVPTFATTPSPQYKSPYQPQHSMQSASGHRTMYSNASSVQQPALPTAIARVANTNPRPIPSPPNHQQQMSTHYHSMMSQPQMQSQPQSHTPIQQQQQQPQPQPHRIPLPVIPAVTAAPGSYAARSAAALSGQPTTTTPTPQYNQYNYQSSNGSNSTIASQPRSTMMHRPGMTDKTPSATASASSSLSFALGIESTEQQQRILTMSIRKVQEHAYYMKQAMEQKNLTVVLDRAAHMVGELGGPPHGHATTGNSQTSSNNSHHNGAPTNTGGSAKLTPKNYYDLYMRALEDMPLLEEYLFNLAAVNATSHIHGHVAASLPSSTSTADGIIHIVADASQLAPTSNSSNGSNSFTMRQLYEYVQYCPRVVSRLYLQIATGSALIRSGECSAKYVMSDLQEAVRCEQNPVRGLFVRYFLITALRDKLPDVPPPILEVPTSSEDAAMALTTTLEDPKEGEETVEERITPKSTGNEETISERDPEEKPVDIKEEGTVKDSYEFVLANFMEMNKLWVRIQHLPGEGNDKEARKRRERERNDLRILVGTNLVRLSQLECVTTKLYGEHILPYILEHIVTTGDPLSQAYLMDCLVQVFPDEYHIETLPILLSVCPRLRDKVNIRTILQGLMDRLAKYLVEKELLDESDTNQVKIALARDSFGLFEECVQNVYNARGPKLTSKEVIRLQTALLQYSIKCFPGYMEQVGRCIDSCVTALQQANASYDANPDNRANVVVNHPSSLPIVGAAALDDASVAELEKLLSIPLDTLALKVLEFESYSRLIGFLPWQNRREVAITMLKAVESSGSVLNTIKDVEQLFKVIEPLVRDESTFDFSSMQQHHATSGIIQHSLYMDPVRHNKVKEENCYVAKLLNTLDHSDTNIVYEMLRHAKQHLTHPLSGPNRTVVTLSALVFAALRLADRVVFIERNGTEPEETVTQIGTENDEALVPSDLPNTKAEVVDSAARNVEDEKDSVLAAKREKLVRYD